MLSGEGPKKPLVSVCMISFNHAKFVRKSIESVLNQEVNFDYEILVHDDASADETSEIIKELSKEYPGRIRYLIQERNIYSSGGKPFAILFAEAKGEFIALCECDDYWVDPCKLQKQYDFLSKNDRFSICYHDAFVVDDEDNRVLDSNVPLRGKRDFLSSELMRGQAALSTQTVMFRNRISLMPEEYYRVINEDSFIFMLLGEFGDGKFLEGIEPAAYRVHAGGVWSVQSDSKKVIASAVSYYWMGVYQERLGRARLGNYFLLKSAKNILRGRLGSPKFWVSSLLVRLF